MIKKLSPVLEQEGRVPIRTGTSKPNLLTKNRIKRPHLNYCQRKMMMRKEG